MNINDTLFCVHDTETTGKDAETARIVEIATVAVNGGTGIITEIGSVLTNPGVSIPPEASAVHHLVDDDVADEGPADVVVTDIIRDTEREPNVVHVAHNSSYDATVIGHVVETGAPWLCTYRLARHLMPDAPGHSNQVLRYWLGLDVPHAEGKPAHRALADAHVTARLLAHLLMLEHGCETVDELIALANSPVELRGKLGFGKHAEKTWDEVPTDYLNWMASKDFESDTMHTVRCQLKRR